MNSIRWMPMIRWLKFPFRVHILHKTVQLSVHELRAGYVCMCLKACPTVPPSPWEQRRERVFNIFFCFLHFIFMIHEYNCCEVSIILCFSFKLFAQISCLTPGSCFGKYVVCNSKPLHFGFFNDRGDTNNFLSVQNRKPQHSIVKILVKFQHSI